MSAAADLLAQAHALGVVIRAGDGVGLEASPPGVLPDLLRNELQLHRADVIRALADDHEVEGQPLDRVDVPTGAALDHAATLRDAWRRACSELGETAGWPALPYKPGHAVAPGTANWLKFIARASVPDMVAVVVALRELLSTMANPPEPDVVPVA